MCFIMTELGDFWMRLRMSITLQAEGSLRKHLHNLLKVILRVIFIGDEKLRVRIVSTLSEEVKQTWMHEVDSVIGTYIRRILRSDH